jgi:transcriptional regulator with XRE-family HTH domain
MKPKNMLKNSRMERLRTKISREDKILIEESYALADRIDFLLKKHHITQRELSKRLGKNESEISKWLSGSHNFTFDTLTKIGIAIGEGVYTIPNKLENIQYLENVLKSCIVRAFKQVVIEHKSNYKKYTSPGLSELEVSSVGIVVNKKHEDLSKNGFTPVLLDPQLFKNIEMSALN